MKSHVNIRYFPEKCNFRGEFFISGFIAFLLLNKCFPPFGHLLGGKVWSHYLQPDRLYASDLKRGALALRDF